MRTLLKDTPKQGWPQALTRASASKQGVLGEKFITANAIFRYVQFNNGAFATDPASGEQVYYKLRDMDGGIVTNDLAAENTASAIGKPVLAAGILMSTPNNDDYCWILVEGITTLSKDILATALGANVAGTGATMTAVAIGARILPSANVVGGLNTFADGYTGVTAAAAASKVAMIEQGTNIPRICGYITDVTAGAMRASFKYHH